jgi:hypothetical protein
MNFYGDLPPAQGESTGTVTSSGQSWTAGAQVVAKSAPAKPTSLAFKPRQTAVAISKPVSAVNAASTAKVVPLASAGTAQRSDSSQILSDQITHPNNVNSMSTEINTIPQFNNNASFDVMEAYDPKFPNEYIAYCEERLERKKVQRMMEENKRVMEEAERARNELERERRDASLRGDIQSLIMSRTEAVAGQQAGGGAMGRGRGRGLTNLPAWMTQQLTASTAAESNGVRFAATDAAPVTQFQNAPPPAAPTAVGVKRKLGGLLNKPSCVLLLKNMVGPEEASEQQELAAETQQECGRYGAVLQCTVYCVSAAAAGAGGCPDEERVRTFVRFESQESAVRAYRYELFGDCTLWFTSGYLVYTSCSRLQRHERALLRRQADSCEFLRRGPVRPWGPRPGPC